MIEKMIEEIAKMFAETMKEENFENFKDMSDCYWWTSEDIKAEVRWGIDNLCGGYGYIFDDGTEIMTWDEKENMSYKSFVAKVKKMANKMMD